MKSKTLKDYLKKKLINSTEIINRNLILFTTNLVDTKEEDLYYFIKSLAKQIKDHQKLTFECLKYLSLEDIYDLSNLSSNIIFSYDTILNKKVIYEYYLGLSPEEQKKNPQLKRIVNKFKQL